MTGEVSAHSIGVAEFSGRALGTQLVRTLAYNRRLAALCGYVLERLSENVSIADLARALCMDRCALARYVRQHTGLTCKQLVLGLKIEAALVFLISHDYAVCELAALVGLSVTTFQRSFRRWMRMAPTEFRRAYLRTAPFDFREAAAS